ncbi:SRPBCC family protein [Caulobacter mirabilis]|uniref:Cyclase n=1 Tax=Caulobacter mirabilis TaxID=69666 RepID=A0A2D2ASN0_9CAUL|nr:SRPBCC family protein [Caulobacter mirabilis]ATQ41009.1 cyclase [Caulobacter mirabilis]
MSAIAALTATAALPGGVVAEVRPDPSGASGVMHGSVQIAAPQKAVWDTLRDCARAGRMSPSVRSCRVVQTDPEGRWDVREMTVRWGVLTPSFRTVFRSDYDPAGRIRFQCVDGDIDCRGEWRLQATEDGGTRVAYDNRATSPFDLPAAIGRAAMRRDLARALKGLKQEAEARAR